MSYLCKMKDHHCEGNDSGHHHSSIDDCCGVPGHTHKFNTSPAGFKIFYYGITFLAGVTLSFLAFQPSRVYRFDIDKDGVKDVIVERYFGRRYFFKGDEKSNILKPLNSSSELTWEIINLRFEAEKELLNS